MSRDAGQRINDILLACRKISRYTTGMDQSTFAADELVQDAVLRNIEIIGEASKKLPPEVRDMFPSIEWKKIAGMRDWLSHVYFQIDDDIVWDVIANKLPELTRALEGFEGSRK